MLTLDLSLSITSGSLAVISSNSEVSLIFQHCFAGDNELYIAGGDNFGAAVYSMYKWCPEENMFEDMAGMQIARKQFVFTIIFVYTAEYLIWNSAM
jgi:hypothetical protein